MSNMSYCRWENTARDLRDCVEDLQCYMDDEGTDDANLYRDNLGSVDEKRSFDRLVELARELIQTVDEGGY